MKAKIDADVMTGRVTFTDGMHLEITIGKPPKPDAKFYVDGNPLGLKQNDEVVVALKRREVKCHLTTLSTWNG